MAGRNISYARTVASSGRRGAGAGSLADEPTLKPKDLVMMPHRIAIAMQDDGWWVRDDIVWLKPNPMPSSVKDRCTPAKEYVFQMTRSGRYFWDAVAIAETAIYAGPNAPDKIKSPMGQGFTRAALRKNDTAIESGNARRARATDGFQDRWDEQAKAGGAPLTRNRRNVWSIATEPYPGGHFATMPTELARLCILAATSAKGCCATCGAPWRRKVERTFHPQPDVSIERGVRGAAGQKPMVDTSDWDGFPRGSIQTETLGWLPTCEHDAPVVPCTVLDPFGGAGTTALVAARLGRNAILIEANPAYVTDHIEPRLADEATPLLDIMEGDAT
jgi:DNA modification methylase